MKELCDKLRTKGGVDWRQAILADQRVEFIRGKDLAAHFREKPDQMLKWVSRGDRLAVWQSAEKQTTSKQSEEMFGACDNLTFVVFKALAKHQEISNSTVATTGASLEDQIKVMAELMMRRQLLVKADRKFKKPRPGMKRRAKWPKKLIHVQEQVSNHAQTSAHQQCSRKDACLKRPMLTHSSGNLGRRTLTYCQFPYL